MSHSTPRVAALCSVCGEEPASYDGRCRDCDIAYIIEAQTCESCGWWCSLLNPGFGGPGTHSLSPLSCPVMAL